jgi:hypothetical protein
MEFSEIEVSRMEVAEQHAAAEALELNELQLALVGGGNAIVTLG